MAFRKFLKGTQLIAHLCDGAKSSSEPCQTRSLITTNTTATPNAPLKIASSAAITLQTTWYNTRTGLWDTCGWWNGANNMIALADLASIDSASLPLATTVFTTTYTNAPAQNPSLPDGITYPWLDSCHDDNGWWALSWIAAYDLTTNTTYLSTAEAIFQNMTSAWPGSCGAGINWCDDSTYTNAITNELFLSVAAHLAGRIPSKEQEYLSWALKQWDFFSSSGMIGPNGTINDGLSSSCTNNGGTIWTYNQGVILGGLVELNRVSPNKTYIDAATSIANAAIEALTNADGVVVESCEPDCDANQTQFKGIFIRNLMALWKVAPSEVYRKVIVASARSIWENDRSAEGQLGVDWTGDLNNITNASTHGSALEALIMAAEIKSTTT